MNGLKAIISKGESQTLEFKQSLNLRDEVAEAVSAMANSRGGTVVVGISDEGKIVGADIGKRTLDELADHRIMIK